MDLKTYRKAQGWTLDQMASLVSGDGVKVDASLVRKHELGLHIPRPNVIERYRLLTNGAITADTFVKQHQRFRKSGGTARQRDPAPA